MTDKKTTDAAWTLLTSFQEANQTIAEHLLSAQERNRKLSERFFTEGMEVLKANQAAAADMVATQERTLQHTQRFFTEGMEVLKANQAAAQSLIAAQERTNQYIQDFFNEGIEVLKSQGESMRALMQELEQQIRKQYEAIQTLIYAPVGTTLDILSTPLAAYQKALGIAETITRQGLEQMQQATQQTQERHNE